MPVKAIKCLKCGGYQNYRRFFDFSSTILALLIALISVTSSALSNIPSIYGIIIGQRGDLGVRTFISGISVDAINVAFANDSSRRVWVDSGTLCRIPKIKEDADLFGRGDVDVRYPTGQEVAAVYDFHFSDKTELGFFIEPTDAALKEFKVSRVIREEGGWNQSAPELIPYCQTTYRDSYGNKGTYWMNLDEISSAHMIFNLAKMPLKQIDDALGGLSFNDQEITH
jgi:hypothetical protein